MAVVPIILGMIDIIDKNMVSKSNVISNVVTGQIVVNVENSFNFSDGQEIIIIDYNYNNPASSHYDKFEYAVINHVNNTHSVTLTQPVLDSWLVSNHAFIQKTIGHAPLYSDKILYGDREVIPTDEMAITVEPLSLSNEWLYIHGGLSEEYRVSIMIYGKDINTDEGIQILNKYTDAVYELFNQNIHLDVNNYSVPLLADVSAGSYQVIVQDTPNNRSMFVPSSYLTETDVYEVQDNIGVEIDLFVTSVSTPGDGKMYINLSQNDPAIWPASPLNRSYSTAELAVFSRHGIYLYDSRIDSVEYGMVQKGSAYVRAARLNWFGKKIQEYKFPQQSHRLNYFAEVEESSSSSS